MAKITGSDGGHATSGPSLFYVYFVDGKEYEGSTYSKNDLNFSLKYYYVIYSEKNPEWSEIDLNRPVKDSFKIKAAGLTLPKPQRIQFKE